MIVHGDVALSEGGVPDPLRLTPALEPYSETFLELEAQASAPYTAFVFPDPLQASAIRDLVFGKGLSEFSSPHGRALLAGDGIVGMIACLTSEELQRCRMRSAFALAKSTFSKDDPEFNARIRLAGETLLKPQSGDFYLARIAIMPAARGRGLAHKLLNWFEDEGRQRKQQRLVLEVHPTSNAAYCLYRAHGFEEVARRAVADPQTGATLEYIHMAKALV